MAIETVEKQPDVVDEFSESFNDPIAPEGEQESEEFVEPVENPFADEEKEEEETQPEDTARPDEAQDQGDDDTGGYKPSEDMLEAAHLAGITSEQAREFHSPSALASAVAGRRDRTETQEPARKAVKPPEVERFEFKSLESLQAKEEDGEFSFAPEVRALGDDVRRMHEHYEKQMTASRETIDALHSDADVVRASQRMEAFDAHLDGLGDEFKDLVGKGRTENMSTGTAQYRSRVRIADEVKLLEAGYAALGKPVPTIQSLTGRAVNTVFADKVATIQRRAIHSKVKKRSSQVISKPTQRESNELSPDARLESVTKKLWADRGLNDDD